MQTQISWRIWQPHCISVPRAPVRAALWLGRLSVWPSRLAVSISWNGVELDLKIFCWTSSDLILSVEKKLTIMDVILLRKAISAVKNPARISTITGCLVDSFTAQPCFPTLKVGGGCRKVDSFHFQDWDSMPLPLLSAKLKRIPSLNSNFCIHNNSIIPITTTWKIVHRLTCILFLCYFSVSAPLLSSAPTTSVSACFSACDLEILDTRLFE